MELLKNILIWIFAILLTATVLIYQRTTGPTYPKSVKVEMGGETVRYKLIRTMEKEKGAIVGKDSARVALKVENPLVVGEFKYKRLGTNDEWTTVEMQRENNELYVMAPVQPAAGKLIYFISLNDGEDWVQLTEEPVVIRFKDHIPDWIPPPHVFLIFIALLFSTIAAVEALRRGKHVKLYTILTLISMFIGGLIMGPLMQKYAFGEYWTGWPFGGDVTDNKTLVAFIVWMIAFFVLRKNPKNRFWPIFAAVITLLVFVVPHSMFGSEFDYSAGAVKTGR